MGQGSRSARHTARKKIPRVWWIDLTRSGRITSRGYRNCENRTSAAVAARKTRFKLQEIGCGRRPEFSFGLKPFREASQVVLRARNDDTGGDDAGIVERSIRCKISI